jgi:hypothetical protein
MLIVALGLLPSVPDKFVAEPRHRSRNPCFLWRCDGLNPRVQNLTFYAANNKCFSEEGLQAKRLAAQLVERTTLDRRNAETNVSPLSHS